MPIQAIIHVIEGLGVRRPHPPTATGTGWIVGQFGYNDDGDFSNRYPASVADWMDRVRLQARLRGVAQSVDVPVYRGRYDSH